MENSNEKVFSLHYSKDIERYEEKEKFKRRLLMYLDDFVNSGWPGDTYRLCRQKMGIDIKRKLKERRPHDYHYCIEATFEETGRTIKDMLDLITIVYDSQYAHKHEGYGEKPLNDLIETINDIFQEESMCYVLHNNGRVRYYPDEEAHQLTKSTLLFLNNPKYLHHLSAFNETLEIAYKNRNKDVSVWSLFCCIEKFVLSCISDKKFKILNESSVDKLNTLIKEKIELDDTFTDNDKEIFMVFKSDFLSWISMCHKYRHEKPQNENKNVPPAIFNYIFSKGISIYRFLLEFDQKCSVGS